MANFAVQKKPERLSGIELLKIIAIFLIVVSHVTQTLGTLNESIGIHDYVIPLGISSTDIQVIILNLFQQTGALGNTIFFVCSAWFLVGKTADASKKAFQLLCTVWCISILYLLIYLLACPAVLTTSDLIHEMFPTCFANNWYLTCYIIFLFIYPMINRLIAVVSQAQLFKIVLFSSLLWIISGYVPYFSFFSSEIIIWVAIYFLIAYLKLYCGQIMTSSTVGIILLTIGIIGYIAQVVFTNFVGLYVIDRWSDNVLMWNSNCCPFYILIAIGSIIIALQKDFKIHAINYISSLSLFVYLIHENILFRTYTRPFIWQYLYDDYGYSHVVLLDLGFALILFIASCLISSIFKETIQRIVTRISSSLYLYLVDKYMRFEKKLLE